MVDGQRLYDLNIEGPASERKKANIYKGKITRIEPSLEAAFIDYGADRHGFLPLKEISSEYYIADVQQGAKANIREVLKEGQDIVVQIDKEERGNKGAALTTFVSLAGRFIVLKPNKSRSGGVSRRIVGADRDLARQSLGEIEIPKGMSVILRTAGIDRSAEELTWDLENLLAVWNAILNVVLQQPSPFLIYRESNAVVRALRDYLTNEIGEILIDDDAIYQEAQEFVEQVMPHNLRKLKKYEDPVPLFTRFQIETQIESAFAHAVHLPSGGSIVIDHTEALVAIDINSARATKGSDIEATALNTNVEAAEEIARQLRLRDLGGLIVIDFIDMGPQKNQREVENRLRDSVRQDRARVQIGKITRFGLLEMSRQRLRPSLGESSYQTCPRCTGFGTIRSVESLALAILRIIGEEARKERTAKVIAQLPVEVATYLLNEKRDWVQGLESRNDTQVILVANSALETPHYDIRRVRDDQVDEPENAGVSYLFADSEPEPEVPQSMQERKATVPAAIGKIEPTSPAPARKRAAGRGIWAGLLALFGSGAKRQKKPSRSSHRRRSSSRSGRGRDSQRDRHRGDSRQNENKRSKRKKSNKKFAKKTNSGDGAAQSRDRNTPPSKAKAPAAKKGESRDEAKRSRNRRTRSGRRRRRSGDRPAQDANTPQQQPIANAEGQDKLEAPAPEKSQHRSKRPEAKSSDPGTVDVTQETASPDGPPKVRTDAERDADKRAATSPDTDGRSQAQEAQADHSDSDPAGLTPVQVPSPAPSLTPSPEPSPEIVANDAQATPGAVLEPAQAQEQVGASSPVAAKKARRKAPGDAKPKPGKKKKTAAEASGASEVPASSGNGSATATPVAAGPDKPAGRLLPWEPAAPSNDDGADKPKVAPAEAGEKTTEAGD
jgi:ribonuclease E